MSQVRHREPRVTVKLNARVKSDIGWGSSQICNVSPGGMMIRHIPAPPLNSYVEICRGSFSVVGRVRWIGCDKFGVQALETIDLDALSNPPTSPKAHNGDRRREERKAALSQPSPPSLAEQLAAAERQSRFLQFIIVVVVGVSMAVLAADLLSSVFAAPLQVARASMRVSQ